jgi:hypothetical protein
MNDGTVTMEQIVAAGVELRSVMGKGWTVFAPRPHSAYRVLPDGSWAKDSDGKTLIVNGWVASAIAPGGKRVDSIARETIAEVADDLRQDARE